MMDGNNNNDNNNKNGATIYWTEIYKTDECERVEERRIGLSSKKEKGFCFVHIY